MTRRTALALAASVALSAAAAAFAVGTTLGLFGAAHTDGPTGRLTPVADRPAESEAPRVETVYVDVTATPRPAGRALEATAPAGAASPSSPEVVFVEDPAPTYSAAHDDGDDHAEDDHAEDEDAEDDGHEGDD